jgi:hypothetical protein
LKSRERNNKDTHNNKIRQGFRLRDEYHLRKFDNPLYNPPTKIWSYEEIEENQPWGVEGIADIESGFGTTSLSFKDWLQRSP